MNKAASFSIQNRLLKALLIGLPALWLFVMILTTYRLWHELSEVDDTQIIQLSYYLLGASQALNGYGLSDDKPLVIDEDSLFDVFLTNNDYDLGESKEDYMGFAIWSADGKLVMADDNGQHFVNLDEQGFVDSSHILKYDNVDLSGTWRFFYGQSRDGYRIAVGQSLESRQEVILTAILAQAIPALVGLVFLLWWAWWSVRFGFAPLQTLSNQLSQRQGRDYTPLSGNVPKEIKPLVDALNHWMTKVSATLEREERFTADASHELRSPLTSLQLQADLLEQTVLAVKLDEKDEERLFEHSQKIKAGVERSVHLTEQLLVLAKLAPTQTLPQDELQLLDWYVVSESVLSAVNVAARQKNSRLKRQISDTPWQLMGSPVLIELLLINLLDNAIRYCPEGSTVSLTIGADYVAVRDDGYGVAAADLVRLSERFFRPAGQSQRGSGLGLSIVKRISDLHQLSLCFDNCLKDDKVVGFEVVIKRI